MRCGHQRASPTAYKVVFHRDRVVFVDKCFCVGGWDCYPIELSKAFVQNRLKRAKGTQVRIGCQAFSGAIVRYARTWARVPRPKAVTRNIKGTPRKGVRAPS